MNNNNFSILRYFRDLGADAHLLLNSNDGKGSLSHFKPECDTWNIAKWKPYIHQTPIPDSPVAALDLPYSLVFGLRSRIWSWLSFKIYQTPIVTINQIQQAYDKYDRLIASGISPATLNRARVKLNVFYPYSSGVEYLCTESFLAKFRGGLGINKYLLTRVSQQQANGICAANNVINGDMGLTNDVLLDLGIQPINLFIPMLYDRDEVPKDPPTSVLRDILGAILNSNFILLHHSRLMWCNPGCYSNDAWAHENKNNDWLLRSFSSFLKKRPTIKACLLMLEYGPDVAATKRLATDLGVNSSIHWLPKMDRREIMWLLSHASIGFGEFNDVPRMIWGGTGWEVLASGKPLIQRFNFDKGEFERIYGYPSPPMLPVRNQDDVLRHLLDMADNVEKRIEIGGAAKKWFESYNGIGLARQWLEIVTNTCEGGVYKKNSPFNQGVHD